MKKDCRIAAIILNYESRYSTIRQSVELNTESAIEPIVIDNSSDQVLRHWCQEQEVQYIDTGTNLGYAGGNNVGLKVAKKNGFEYGFILNPDVTIKNISSNQLLSRLDGNMVDIAFPDVIESGNKIKEELPTIENKVLRAGGDLPPLPESSDEGIKYVDHGPGCAMIVRLSVLDDMGYLNESFFMYGEEVEFCYRARLHGYRTAIIFDLTAVHSRNDELNPMSGFKMYYNLRNKFLLYELIFDKSLIYPALIVGHIIKYTIRIIWYRNWNLLRPLLYGLLDGIRLKAGSRRY
jgi:GT2 family glycosyltransferase